MAITKINALALGSVAKVNSLLKASIAKINSLANVLFADSYAISKSINTSSDHSIAFTDTNDTFNFVEDEAWTISFWVKAGWNSSLNTNIHFIIGQEAGGPAYQLSDMIKMMYNESNNRLYFQYGNKTTSSNAKQKQVYWLFHTNSGSYATAYAAAGLGATYWSAANRGNVGDDDYTMITMTKAAADDAGSLTAYWNAATLGTSTEQKNEALAVGMDATGDRIWSLGSNGIHSGNDQLKCGNNTATVYNDLTIWNKELSSGEVSELYNSGTRLDATGHSAASNLIGYWKFEGNANASVGDDNFTIAGEESAIVAVGGGD